MMISSRRRGTMSGTVEGKGARMTNICVVVADGSRARVFLLRSGAGPRVKNELVEQQGLTNSGNEAPQAESRHSNRDAGPRHPYGAQRERHHLELERRFAAEIVKRATAQVSGWRDGILVLVAEPRLLGLLRENLRAALASGIRLKELARDYTGFSAADLQQQLESSNMLQA
ncbi:MAG: host attachment protein [Betaproteobacteria bacterium]|nr:host attachment protein [Betaproteobacteria bacterium]